MKNILYTLVIIILGILCGYLLSAYMNLKKKKSSVTSSMIESRLADCSELTTCNLVYVDLVKYENGTIPFISKKSFSMIYQANVRAGIDLSKAAVKVTPTAVRIELPETEVQSIEVDTNSLRFYDEHFALFNWNNKEDITEAIVLAKNDAEKNIDFDKLKAQARLQAEKVISKLIEPIVKPDRTLTVE